MTPEERRRRRQILKSIFNLVQSEGFVQAVKKQLFRLVLVHTFVEIALVADD